MTANFFEEITKDFYERNFNLSKQQQVKMAKSSANGVDYRTVSLYARKSSEIQEYSPYRFRTSHRKSLQKSGSLLPQQR